MTTIYPNQCVSCEHYDLDGSTLAAHYCAAFPQGINPSIWLGFSSHWDPMDDGSDGGITYEPRIDAEEDLQAYITFHYDIEPTPFVPDADFV